MGALAKRTSRRPRSYLRNPTTTTTTTKMKFAAAATCCVVLAALVAAHGAAAQNVTTVLESAPDTMMNGTIMNMMNETMGNATASSAEEGAPAGDPVFSYEAIFPGGIFSAEAYGNWLRAVSAYYTNMYTNMYTEAAAAETSAIESAYSAAFNPATYFTGSYGGYGFPGFRPSFGNIAQQWQAALTG